MVMKVRVGWWMQCCERCGSGGGDDNADDDDGQNSQHCRTCDNRYAPSGLICDAIGLQIQLNRNAWYYNSNGKKPDNDGYRLAQC